MLLIEIELEERMQMKAIKKNIRTVKVQKADLTALKWNNERKERIWKNIVEKLDGRPQ